MDSEKDYAVEEDRPSSEKGSPPAEHDKNLIYTDPIHIGLCGPTDEEKHTLRRVPDALPWSAYCK